MLQKILPSLRRSPRKHRKPLLISLDWTRPKDPPLSLGHASILANLKKNNIPSIHRSWAVNHPNFRSEEVVQFIMQQKDENLDVAMGAFVWNEPYLQRIIQGIKQEGFPGRIILGGPQISYVKENIEAYYPLTDVFIRGYAEDAMASLFSEKEEKHVVAGVHYAGEPDLGISAKVDLEAIPSPFLTGIIEPQPFIRWETQRGCPFRCSFCQHRESDVSMKRRNFDISRVMQEIDWIIANPVIQDIAVLDPTFNTGPHYLEILHAFAEKKFTGKLSLQCRIEMVTPEFLEVVQEINKNGRVVLEFGLQTIHKNEQALIQRPNNMAKVKHIFTEVKQRNIETEVSLIFGLPGQTVESFKESVDFCKSYNVPRIYAFPLMLLRGTPLYDQKRQLGLIESTDIHLEKIPRQQQNIPHVVASQTFSYKEWLEMANIAESLDDYNHSMSANRTNPISAKMSETLRHTFWNTSREELSMQRSEPTISNDRLQAAELPGLRR